MTKKQTLYLYCMLLSSAVPTHGITEKVEQALSAFKFSGWVRHSSFLDTRQVRSDREGHGIFYPLDRKNDACGNDINAHGQFNMLPIRTRIKTKIRGPQIHEAKSSGYIEVDFYGKTDLPNILRMRHAYLNLDWKHLSLRAGQYWHPLYVSEAAAETISVTSGFPIQCHGRSPQIRATVHYNPFELKLAAITQLDGTSDGPHGRTSQYLRNAVIPNLHVQLKGSFDDHFAGIAIDWKRIRPRLYAESQLTGTLFKVDEDINSVSGIAYLSINFPSWHLNTKCIYSENLRELKQLSGYAVKTRDSVTGKQTYTNTRAVSWWVDAATVLQDESFEPGLFVGYTKNIGSRDCLFRDENGNVIIFARAPDIDHIIRVAPRIRWKIQTFTLGAEVEYIHAAYGTIDNHGKIIDTHNVNNVRFHLALFYYF